MIGQPWKSSVDGILVSDTLRAVLAALGCVLGSLGNHGPSQGSKDQATWSPPALACWSLELIMTDFRDYRIVEHEEGFNSWSTSFVWAIDIFPRYLFLLINVSNSMNHLSSNIFIPRMLQLQTASISVHQYFQGRLLSSPPQPNRRALVFTALLKGYLMLRKLLYGDRTSWKPLKSLNNRFPENQEARVEFQIWKNWLFRWYSVNFGTALTCPSPRSCSRTLRFEAVVSFVTVHPTTGVTTLVKSVPCHPWVNMPISSKFLPSIPWANSSSAPFSDSISSCSSYFRSPRDEHQRLSAGPKIDSISWLIHRAVLRSRHTTRCLGSSEYPMVLFYESWL